ncbi:MAG: thioredoxin [Acidobacteria bacterium]|nr:thioredoxin [Acidobacteriota bacterium]
MIAVTTDTFEPEVRQAAQPVLVDVWGPRCGPCLALMPFVEEVAGQYSDRLKVVKVNAQENRRLCVQLKVMSLPTFLFYSQGQEVGRMTGEVKAHELQRWIEERLNQAV